jgi:hypothetical protein
VIKNERQYRITRAWAKKFRASLEELTGTPRARGIHPRLWEAQKAGLQSQLTDLEAELYEYESLKSRAPSILHLDRSDADGLEPALSAAAL